MAIEGALIQNTRVRTPIEADLPLDSRTIESLGLPKEIDRRDLLAFLASQSARLATVVEPPLFRSLEGQVVEPMTSPASTETTLSDSERSLLQGWTAELIGGNLTGLTDDELDTTIGQYAQRIDNSAYTIQQRQDAAPPPAPGGEGEEVTDPAFQLPGAPQNELDRFFNEGVFQSELKAMEDFDLGGWKKNLREIAKKGDPIAIILAVFAFIEARAGKVFKAFAADQVAQNDRLSAAADLAQKIPVIAGDDTRLADTMTRRLTIKVGTLQNEAGMSMMRIREHLTAMAQIEQTLTSTKNIYHQTQIQGIIRRIT